MPAIDSLEAGRNLLVFADGTGQAGGLVPDEVRTNIYKLYRATRSGPDTCIDAKKQIAFYDPGIGSAAANTGISVTWLRAIFNLACQITGLGITRSIIDCYAALIQIWRPGDRIYLFGFSRGAYTIRCLASVLRLCGIPTTAPDTDNPLPLDPTTIRRVAKEAVKNIYQHAWDTKTPRFIDQQEQLSARFRQQYHSGNDENSNANPHFIGVFETVAALGLPKWMRLSAYIVGVLVAWAILKLLGAALGAILPPLPYGWPYEYALYVLSGIVALGLYWNAYVRATTHTNYCLVKTFHVSGWHPPTYDEVLSDQVAYARHAISIDEARRDFRRVSWVQDHRCATRDERGNIRFEQIWFAGDHADIGGGYAEAESRLSDITLKWMSDEVRRLPSPILADPRYLQLSPSFDGPAHDEVQHGVGGYHHLKWPAAARHIPGGALLHPSVFQRFQAVNVRGFMGYAPYRPLPIGENIGRFSEYRPVLLKMEEPQEGC